MWFWILMATYNYVCAYLCERLLFNVIVDNFKGCRLNKELNIRYICLKFTNGPPFISKVFLSHHFHFPMDKHRVYCAISKSIQGFLHHRTAQCLASAMSHHPISLALLWWAHLPYLGMHTLVAGLIKCCTTNGMHIQFAISESTETFNVK